MRAILHRELGPGDRPDPERLGRLGELHRPVQAVVVGQPERRMALLGGSGRELLRVRRPIQERVGGVAVELDI